MPATKSKNGYQQALQILCRERRNRALSGIVVTHLLWIGAVLLTIFRPGAGTFALAFLLIGAMQYRIVLSCHEATHKTLLFPVWLNEWVGLIHSAMVGINFVRYRRQHMAHHCAKTIDADPDAYIYQPVLAAPAGLRRTVVMVFGCIGEIVEKVRQKGVGGEEPPHIARRAQRHSRAVIAMQILLLATFTLAFGWWGYALWLGPLLTVALFLNRVRIVIEHGVPHLDLLPEQVGDAGLETIDVLTNPVERFFLAPYSFNYHYAHHTVPSVPHYNNERLSRLLDDQHRPNTRRVRASYVRLLIRTLEGRPVTQDARLNAGGIRHAIG